jgi:hypothetical protein
MLHLNDKVLHLNSKVLHFTYKMQHLKDYITMKEKKCSI